MNPQPAIMNKREVCRLLRKSPQTFDRMRPELEHRGFPKRDNLLQGWPVSKVQKWLNQRFEKEDEIAEQERIALERINGEAAS